MSVVRSVVAAVKSAVVDAVCYVSATIISLGHSYSVLLTHAMSHIHRQPPIHWCVNTVKYSSNIFDTIFDYDIQDFGTFDQGWSIFFCQYSILLAKFQFQY